MSFLEVKCLRKRFPSPDGGDTFIVDVESFSLKSGAHCAMKGESGAVIVMNPKNGDLLALASFPDFDPNLFSNDDANATIPYLEQLP